MHITHSSTTTCKTRCALERTCRNRQVGEMVRYLFYLLAGVRLESLFAFAHVVSDIVESLWHLGK